MSALFDKQVKFTLMVSKLIQMAEYMGYKVTLGDAYRDPRVFGALGVKMGYGNANSCHKSRLAIDLNLFKDGVFLTTTEGHKPLGEWWELEGGTWGGRFKDSKGNPTQDGNHYSLDEGSK